MAFQHSLMTHEKPEHDEMVTQALGFFRKRHRQASTIHPEYTRVNHTADKAYRGRLAPTPTGFLHLGHAATFLRAQQRCNAAGGTMVYRDEDIDRQRCKPEYAQAAMEDLAWLGLQWQEGPDCGGPHAPYTQSDRHQHYLRAWEILRDGGHIYPCQRSRKELREFAPVPDSDEQDAEPLFPPQWRPPPGSGAGAAAPGESIWRFRVPDGETIAFHDAILGEQRFTAGVDFGDFPIWRRENMPAYELAVVVDDIAMAITEVVRGADLLKSTARQLLLYRALGADAVPGFAHCPLLRDESGKRLAKRHASLSLRKMRESGMSPDEVRKQALGS